MCGSSPWNWSDNYGHGKDTGLYVNCGFNLRLVWSGGRGLAYIRMGAATYSSQSMQGCRGEPSVCQSVLVVDSEFWDILWTPFLWNLKNVKVNKSLFFCKELSCYHQCPGWSCEGLWRFFIGVLVLDNYLYGLRMPQITYPPNFGFLHRPWMCQEALWP